MAKVDMVMPQMGESIAEGTIIKWLKKEGDKVEKDEIILEISTDKVDSEIPSPQAGVLTKLLATEGQTVKVGSAIATIETEAATQPAKEMAPPANVPEKKPEPAAAKPAPVPQGLPRKEPVPEVKPPVKPAEITREHIPAMTRTDGNGKKFYSPLVRSIAKSEGLSVRELEQIEGTGLSGRVTKNDILAYLEQRKAPMPSKAKAAPAYVPPAQPEFSDDRVEIIPMDHMRKSIAAHMVNSVQTSPHVFAVSEADMTNLVRYREKHKDAFQKREGFKLTYMPLIVQACALSLRDYPLVNSSVQDEKIIRKK
ncbi:MAG TPA: dihydrolipoamide acetyltransferase family protein, partial [bacterium]